MKGVYEELKPHIGHKFVCVTYADGENIALECMDCMAVVVDADREPEEVASIVVECADCDGTGDMEGDFRSPYHCENCHGEGEVIA